MAAVRVVLAKAIEKSLLNTHNFSRRIFLKKHLLIHVKLT